MKIIAWIEESSEDAFTIPVQKQGLFFHFSQKVKAKIKTQSSI